MTTYKIDHENNKSAVEEYNRKVNQNHENEKLDKKFDTEKDNSVTTDID